MWMYILGAIGLVIAALLFSPIVVKVAFEDTLEVVVSFWFVRYRVYPQKKKTKSTPIKAKVKKQPSSEMPQKKQSVVQKVKQIFGVMGTLVNGSLRLLKNARVRKLDITLGVTGEDAAAAAIHYGQVCSVVYPFLGLVDSHMKLIDPKVNVYCDYEGAESVIKGSGKLYISVYHAVGTALYILKELVMKTIKR